MTMHDLCYCNPRPTTDGGTTGHALGADPLRSSEWQRGYDAGYAAGLAKGKER